MNPDRLASAAAQIVGAVLDVRRDCHRANAYDAEQALDEAVVVGHQQHYFVVPSDAETRQSGSHLLGARLQFGVSQGDIALLNDHLVRVE